jgi:transcription factor SFP1
MRDFSCCGQTLATLHDLLQHYEECHAQQTPQSLRMPQPTRAPTQPDSKAAIASQAATAVQQQAAQQYRQQLAQQQSRPQSATGQGASALSGGIQQMRQQQQQQQRSQIQHQQQRQQSQPATPTASNSNVVDLEMDGVEDMEMDDAIGPMEGINDTQNISTPRAPQPSQQTGFGQQARAPTLNMSNTGLLGGLRTSQPTTPATTAFAFNTNPTVSSVNTPNLTTQAAQQGTTFSPDSSIPGTPAEDEDFSLNPYANLNLNNMNWNLAANELGLDYCIDEPAKRLFSPNGAQRNQNALQQQFASFGLANGGFGTGNTQSDLMARYRQQQMMAMNGMNGTGAGGGVVGLGMGMGLGLPEENKPFRCPVIGCEKAYKNQNGLKSVFTRFGMVPLC